MLLYHYNREKYKTLLTRDLQGAVTDKERKDGIGGASFRGDIGPYFEHVSFLLEPAPLDILSGIFPKDHHTWSKGTKLVEHVVDLSGQDFYGWAIVEGPVSMFFLDHVPWSDNQTYKKLFFKGMQVGRKWFKESGTDYQSLMKALKRIPAGTTRKAYENLPKRKDYGDVKNLYAATVPHLMVYTKQPIKVLDTTNVTVEHTSTITPPSSHW